MAWRPGRNAGRLLAGVVGLVAVWAGTTWIAAPRVESALQRAVRDAPDAAALRRAGTRTVIHGRDATLVQDFDLPPARREALAAIVRGVRGIRRVRIETATAETMRPFRLAIRRDAEGLRLRGFVPPGDLHARLLERALALGPADRIDDGLAPGLGAPADFASAAETALTLAGHLSRGEAVLSDRLLSVAGETDGFPAYNTLMTGLAALPPGYALGSVEVLPPVADPFVWRAERTETGLRLAGFVPSEAARTALRARAAAQMPGVTVSDDMQTARGLDPGIAFAGVAEAGLAALDALDDGRVVYAAGRLSVAGRSAARDLLAALPDMLARALPVGVVPGALALTPVPARPYRFVARRADDRLTLSGYTPDSATRDALRQAAERLFVGEAVQTDLRLADGAPDGFAAAVGSALGGLAQLADGRAEIRDRSVTLAGRSLYAEAAGQMPRQLAAAMPAGWTSQAVIRSEPSEKPLEISLCADLLADSLGRDPIRFEPARDEIATASRRGLDGLVAVLRRCGGARIGVAVRPDMSGDSARPGPDPAAVALSDSRAATLARSLAEASGARVTPDTVRRVAGGTAAPPLVAFSVEPEGRP